MRILSQPALAALAWPLLACWLALAPAAAADAIEDGLRKAAPCATCHGSDGNSAASVFPKLAGLNARFMIRQLRDIKSGRRQVPEMAGQLDSLTDRDFQDIAAFYASQKMTGGAANAEQVALGESIYRGGRRSRKIAACIACHSPTGAGNALIGFPRIGGQFADYIAKRLRFYRVAECEAGEMHCMMTQTARQLSNAEIDAVASYVSGLGE